MKTIKELQIKLEKLGIEKFRASQIFDAVFREGKLDYSEISTLPKDVRRLLADKCPILSVKPVRSLVSSDKKTEKFLFELSDGSRIETVLMRFGDGRNSVCVSSQVGCQMGCVFCGTGKMKFVRNLTAEEIADQVLYCASRLQKSGRKVTNVIYMGMGEPFMNYDNVIASIKMLNDKKALNIGIRNITVSTSGICEGIEKLGQSGLQVNLAVSLHSADQGEREKIMPVARKYDLSDLMTAVCKYIHKTNRRVSYEYVMLKGINDGEDDAIQLAALLKGQLCHINLIPYNATEFSSCSGSSEKAIERFRKILKKAHIAVTVRVSMGGDIAAGCGQLAATQGMQRGAPVK
jgi:23S rRNA (adenine2503-C2)-methyltransferase